MTSSSLQPNIRAAAGFQDTIVPASSAVTIPSAADWTIAARDWFEPRPLLLLTARRVYRLEFAEGFRLGLLAGDHVQQVSALAIFDRVAIGVEHHAATTAGVSLIEQHSLSTELLDGDMS